MLQTFIISMDDAQMNRWTEHFKQLLNQPKPTGRPNIFASKTKLHVDSGPGRT